MAIASQTANETEPQRKYQADSLVWGILFALLLTVVQRGAGLVRSVLFCRFLPDGELGQWSLVYSFLIFFAPLVILGFPGSFGRYVEHYRQKGLLKPFILRVAGVTGTLSLVALSAMIVAGSSFSWFIFGNNSQTNDVWLLGFVLVVVIWHNFLAELLESLRQIKLVAWMRFANSITFAIVSIGCVLIRGPYVSSLVIGFVAGATAGSIPGLWYLARNHQHFPTTGAASEFSMWRKVLPYAGWVWAINALTNLFGMADRYMLLHFSGTENEQAQSAVGQYHSGMVLPMILINLAALVTGALMPYMASAWEKNKKDETSALLRTALKLAAIGFTMGGLILVLLAPILFETILENRYEGGLHLLPIAFVYYIWFSLSNICLTYLWCAEKGWNSAVALGIGLITNLFFNWLLIPEYGIYGAVTATVIANGLVLSLMYLLSWINGWKIDLGVVLTSCLPLVLLLNPMPAIAVAFCAIVIVCHGNWILDPTERDYLDKLIERVRSKFAKFAPTD